VFTGIILSNYLHSYHSGLLDYHPSVCNPGFSGYLLQVHLYSRSVGGVELIEKLYIDEWQVGKMMAVMT
jgi:hypothetical protein